MSNTNLQDLTTQVRRDILRMVHKVNSGHPGGSLGCTEFLVALYTTSWIAKKALIWMAITKIYFFYRTVIFRPYFIVY